MQFMNPSIEEFIRQMKTLNTVGCLKVRRQALPELLAVFKKASALVCETHDPTRVFYQVLSRGEVPEISSPAVLIVVEEEYSQDLVWAESIKEIAGYFMNVG